MFSTILLGYKLDFLLDEDTYDELAYKKGFYIIEDVKNCTTYVGRRISEKIDEGGEEIVITFETFHATKNNLLAAVAESPEMSNWVRTNSQEMKLWHINLED
jgi:hypothetical protein